MKQELITHKEKEDSPLQRVLNDQAAGRFDLQAICCFQNSDN